MNTADMIREIQAKPSGRKPKKRHPNAPKRIWKELQKENKEPSRNPATSRLQNGSKPATKTSPKISEKKANKPPKLPRLGAQKTVLEFLFHLQENAGGKAPQVSRNAIAEKCGISLSNAKMALYRLNKKGLIRHTDATYAPGIGGTRYLVPAATKTMLTEADRSAGEGSSDPATKEPLNPATKDTLLVVRSNTTNQPTGGSDFAARLKKLIRLEDPTGKLGLGVNDLVTAWRKGNHETEDSFCESVEHVMFYLAGDQADGLTKPRRWAIRQLERGHYAEPAGYEPRAIRIERERSKKLQDKLAELTKLRRENEEAEFSIWEMELGDAEAKKIIGPVPASRTSVAAIEILKNHYREHVLGQGPARDTL